MVTLDEKDNEDEEEDREDNDNSELSDDNKSDWVVGSIHKSVQKQLDTFQTK